MKWMRRRRRAAADFAEAIRPELRNLSSPTPSEALFARIVASRRSGTRVILPNVAEAPRPSRGRLYVAAGLVAVLLVFVLPFRLSVPPAMPRTDVSSLERIATEWLPGSVAFAQTDAAASGRRLLPMALARPDKLRPRRLEYLRRWRDSAGTDRGRVNGVITVDTTVHGSVPAWLVVSRNEGVRNGRRLLAVDSIVVARETLRLLHRTTTERPYSRYDEIRIVQAFHGDSVVGRMVATGADASPAGRPIARRLSAALGPYIVDGLAPVVLGAVDVRSGWSASASVLGWAVRDDDVSVPIELRVEGEEAVSVPAGQFDCWRVTVRYAGRALVFWLRKSDGVGVRTIDHEPRGVTREVVLIRDSPL